MSKPTVLITAGGNNSRFFPLNTVTHKGGIELFGKPLITRTLESLQDHGFKHVVIVVSEKDFEGRGLSEVLKNEDFPELEIEFMHQKEAKGMGDAVLTAEEKLGEQFCVIFPYVHDGGELLDQMLELGERDVVCAAPTDKPWDYGILSIENGKANGIVEKPAKGEEVSNLKDKGIYLLSEKFLNKLKEQPESEYNFEAALNELMNENPVPVLQLETDLPSLKYPWHLFEHQEYLFSQLESHIPQSAHIADTAIIDETFGPVYLGENVSIGHAAKIVGPCYIGDNVLIGDFSFVRKSSIEAFATVGANTEVVRSIILSQSTLHFGYLADSIVGRDVKIGAGLITANKRLDRESVTVKVKDQSVSSGREGLGVIIGHQANLGIRVSTMPGTCIGGKATVFPGQIIFENVPEGATKK